MTSNEKRERSKLIKCKLISNNLFSSTINTKMVKENNQNVKQ